MTSVVCFSRVRLWPLVLWPVLSVSLEFASCLKLLSWCCSLCPLICLHVLSSVLWRPLRFPHKYGVWFFFIPICLLEGSYLIYVICIIYVLWFPYRLDYMSNITGVLSEAGTAYPSPATSFTPIFLVGSEFIIFIIIYVALFFFVFLRSLSWLLSLACPYLIALSVFSIV